MVTSFHLYKTALKSILTKSNATMKTGHLAHIQRITIVIILKMSLSHVVQVRFRLLISLSTHQHLRSLKYTCRVHLNVVLYKSFINLVKGGQHKLSLFGSHRKGTGTRVSQCDARVPIEVKIF